VERVVFADSWRPFFSEIGLESFDDFYDYAGGTKIGQNNKRNVYRLTLGREPDSKVFYIKRFHDSHFKDMLTAWRNFGRLTSQAGIEWGNADLLLRNGIDTYKPVCMGERIVWKLERKSFLITEQLKSTCLLDFVVERWRSLDRAQQEKIIVAMGKLARRVHELNISLPDLYIWHIYIDEGSLEDNCCLSVIDLHRMLRNVRNANKKIGDLGKLYWSLSGEYFDDEHKDLLVATYAGDSQPDNKDRIVRKVLRQAAITDSRRKLADHYARVRIVSA